MSFVSDKLDEENFEEEDFNLDELDEEEESVEFESEEIEDYRDVDGREVHFSNKSLQVDMNDKHHCNIYILPEDQRTTSQIMTLEEMTEAVGIRVTEIENGSPIFTDVEGFTCPIQMARKELFDGKSPLKLERIMKMRGSTKIVEMWNVNEMTLPISRREQRALTQKQINEYLGVAPAPKPKALKKTKEPTETPKKTPEKIPTTAKKNTPKKK